jgi:SagB-type dehydrogenase family enzyme
MSNKLSAERDEVILSPFLELSFRDTGIVISELQSVRDFEFSEERLIKFISKCMQTLEHTKCAQIASEIFGCALKDAIEFVRELIETRILVCPTDPNIIAMIAMRDEWESMGWGNAFHFHLAAMNYQFLDYALPEGREPDYALMRSYLSKDPLPAKYKTVASDTVIYFENFEEFEQDSSKLWEILSQCPRDSTKILSKKRLGQFLFATVGKIGEKEWPDQGMLLRKTSPSGGARHPTEVYVAVLDIAGIPSGVYHYSVEKHALVSVLEESPLKLIEILRSSCPDLASRVLFQPSAVLFYTSIFERAMWRYRESRSHRVNYIDVGHILWTSRCVSAALGINYFQGHGVIENQVEEILAIDGINESVMFMSVLGSGASNEE